MWSEKALLIDEMVVPGKIKVGIIGYGFSARIFHIPFLQASPDFELVAIVQRSVSSAGKAEDGHPGVVVFTTAKALFDCDNVDVVVIATRPDSHYKLAMLALVSGKHGIFPYASGTRRKSLMIPLMTVIVEKPFTPTSQEANELICAAAKVRRLLTVYHSMSMMLHTLEY